MTTFNCKSSTFIAFLCLAFLLSSTNGEDKVSCFTLRWRGTCFDDRCDERCRQEEGADRGACNNTAECWCQYKCCARPSGTWNGPCFSPGICEKQCQKQENADSGTCSHNPFHCLCLYKC